MIIGTGIDIVEVDRIATKIMNGSGFLEKVFSAGEIIYCESKANKAQHYAARFAAKEAFLKATGLGLMAGLDLHNIELIHDKNEKPSIRLTGAFKQLAKNNQWLNVHVSISHVQSVACAIIIIEK